METVEKLGLTCGEEEEKEEEEEEEEEEGRLGLTWGRGEVLGGHEWRGEERGRGCGSIWAGVYSFPPGLPWQPQHPPQLFPQLLPSEPHWPLTAATPQRENWSRHISAGNTHTHTHSSECLVLEHPRWVGFLKDNDDAGKNEISIYTFIFILKGTNTIQTHL